MCFSLSFCPSFFGKAAPRVWCSKKHFCVCALLTLLLLHEEGRRGIFGTTSSVTSLSKNTLSLASIAWQSLFREHNNALFEGSSSLSTFFLSAFLKTTRARLVKDVYCVPLKVFRETKEPKSGFLFTRTTRASSGRLRKGRREEERARVECNRSRVMRKTRIIFVPVFFLDCATENMCRRRQRRTRRREKMEARPTTGEREKSEDNGNGLLWRIVMDHQDIFDTHIVTKLNGNDVKFFYDVNREAVRCASARPSRLEILTQRLSGSEGTVLPDAFKTWEIF